MPISRQLKQNNFRLSSIPANAENYTYLSNKNRAEMIEALRQEYIAWVVHFYGATDYETFQRIKTMTMKDVEMLMRLHIQHGVSKKAQEKREEERKQKELLDKLKRQK